MNGFMTKEQIERIRKQYPTGTRIELINMEDPYSPVEAGMKGAVKCVDDAGSYG